MAGKNVNSGRASSRDQKIRELSDALSARIAADVAAVHHEPQFCGQNFVVKRRRSPCMKVI